MPVNVAEPTEYVGQLSVLLPHVIPLTADHVPYADGEKSAAVTPGAVPDPFVV